MIRDWPHRLFDWAAVRGLAALAFLVRARLYWLCGLRYRSVCDLCWIVRVSGVDSIARIARSTIDDLIDDARRTGRNALVDWFMQSRLSRHAASGYSLSGSVPRDIFRDLIVLKPASADEKGVILLKYGRTFEAVIALFDFRRLLDRYTFVLEPSWAGYCDPAILMFIAPGHPVIVQCFTNEDQAFIESIGPPFFAVRLGPADWVDADAFQDTASQPKIYDLVMVANWGAHKRHSQLFKALARIRDRQLRVLLVGFPWARRTREDILREAREITGDRFQIDIVERIPHSEVARLLNQCKAFVFLSRKEGDNKALVEAMFANLPAIVYDRTVGGARGRINPATGVLSSDDELDTRICYVLDHLDRFRPREWALEHTGSRIATRRLDEALRRVIGNSGGQYRSSIVEKTNAPNLAYRDPVWRERFEADYDFILSCLRHEPVK